MNVLLINKSNKTAKNKKKLRLSFITFTKRINGFHLESPERKEKKSSSFPRPATIPDPLLRHRHI